MVGRKNKHNQQEYLKNTEQQHLTFQSMSFLSNASSELVNAIQNNQDPYKQSVLEDLKTKKTNNKLDPQNTLQINQLGISSKKGSQTQSNNSKQKSPPINKKGKNNKYFSNITKENESVTHNNTIRPGFYNPLAIVTTKNQIINGITSPVSQQDHKENEFNTKRESQLTNSSISMDNRILESENIFDSPEKMVRGEIKTELINLNAIDRVKERKSGAQLGDNNKNEVDGQIKTGFINLNRMEVKGSDSSVKMNENRDAMGMYINSDEANLNVIGKMKAEKSNLKENNEEMDDLKVNKSQRASVFERKVRLSDDVLQETQIKRPSKQQSQEYEDEQKYIKFIEEVEKRNFTPLKNTSEDLYFFENPFTAAIVSRNPVFPNPTQQNRNQNKRINSNEYNQEFDSDSKVSNDDDDQQGNQVMSLKELDNNSRNDLARSNLSQHRYKRGDIFEKITKIIKKNEVQHTQYGVSIQIENKNEGQTRNNEENQEILLGDERQQWQFNPLQQTHVRIKSCNPRLNLIDLNYLGFRDNVEQNNNKNTIEINKQIIGNAQNIKENELKKFNMNGDTLSRLRGVFNTPKLAAQYDEARLKYNLNNSEKGRESQAIKIQSTTELSPKIKFIDELRWKVSSPKRSIIKENLMMIDQSKNRMEKQEQTKKISQSQNLSVAAQKVTSQIESTLQQSRHHLFTNPASLNEEKSRFHKQFQQENTGASDYLEQRLITNPPLKQSTSSRNIFEPLSSIRNSNIIQSLKTQQFYINKEESLVLPQYKEQNNAYNSLETDFFLQQQHKQLVPPVATTSGYNNIIRSKVQEQKPRMHQKVPLQQITIHSIKNYLEQ